MVFLDLVDDFPKTNTQIIQDLKSDGILVGSSKGRGFRLVTHFGISEEDIIKVAEVFSTIFR
jgi:hypothetical protein